MESDERDKDRGNISKSPSISFDEARRFDGFIPPLPESLERDNDKDKNKGASSAEIAGRPESGGGAVWAKAVTGNANAVKNPK